MTPMLHENAWARHDVGFSSPRGEERALMAWANPWLWVSAAVFIIDQVTKYLAEAHLTYGAPTSVLRGFFDLRLAYNPGAAFSFLSDAGGWQRWFFIALAIGVSIWLVIWLKDTPRKDKMTSAGLALVLGGAVGNALDRILPRRAMVVDFLDFYVGAWHWPAGCIVCKQPRLAHWNRSGCCNCQGPALRSGVEKTHRCCHVLAIPL